ncbi:MAG: hypothetical protein ACOC35_03760, partial [Promethearchaeia archaeon]
FKHFITYSITYSNYIAYMSKFVAKKAENAGLIQVISVEGNPVIAEREIYLVKRKNKRLKQIEGEFWKFIEKI